MHTNCWKILCLTIALFVPASQALGAQKQTKTDTCDCNSPDQLANIVCHIQIASARIRETSFPYVLTREYKIYKVEDQKVKSEVVANISFVPPDHKSYTIEKVEGNSRGAGIIKNVLETETEQASKEASGAISPKNYHFELLGQGLLDGQPVWILALLPLREDRSLIRGKVWVDKNTYLIHRISGDLAKNPSFWIKKVSTTIDFGGANGLWIQTNSRAIADVRLLGKHVFDARAVQLRTGGEVAQTFSSAPPIAPVPQVTRVKSRQRPRSPRRRANIAISSSPALQTPAPQVPSPAVVGAGVFVRR